MWQKSSAPGSLYFVILLPKSFFAHISSCQVFAACGFQFQQPSLWRAFSDCSTWHRSPPSTFSYSLSTSPLFFFYSQHLALWVMSWSIKMLTCVPHAFCFSESKEFIDAFEFLICLLFIAFSIQKSFQTLLTCWNMQSRCAALISIIYFGFCLIKCVQRMRKGLYHPREKQVSHTWLQSLWITTSLRHRQA